MSGYMGSDGSQLAGGLNPSGIVQGLAVDLAGRLIAAPMSIGMPLISEDQLRAAIIAGQAFTAFQRANTGAAANIAISLYSPGTKNVFLYRMRVSAPSNGGTVQIWVKNTDFALGSLSGGPFNRNLGSATASTCTLSGSNAAVTSGTKTDEGYNPSNNFFEFVQNGSGIYIPAGTSFAAMLMLMQSAADLTSCSYDWIEF